MKRLIAVAILATIVILAVVPSRTNHGEGTREGGTGGGNVSMPKVRPLTYPQCTGDEQSPYEKHCIVVRDGTFYKWTRSVQAWHASFQYACSRRDGQHNGDKYPCVYDTMKDGESRYLVYLFEKY